LVDLDLVYPLSRVWAFHLRHVPYSVSMTGAEKKLVFTSGKGSAYEPAGRDWWFFIKRLLFFLASNRVVISSKNLVNFRFLYCCCRSILEAWKRKGWEKSFQETSLSQIFLTELKDRSYPTNFGIILIHRLKVLKMEVLPIMSSFLQVDYFLVVKMLLKSDPESPVILFSEIFHLECVRHHTQIMSLDEDHICGFVRFLRLIVRLSGFSQLLDSQVKLHIFYPLQVVSFRDLQSSEIQLIEV